MWATVHTKTIVTITVLVTTWFICIITFFNTTNGNVAQHINENATQDNNSPNEKAAEYGDAQNCNTG
ncbi:hypothetical protein EaACW_pEI700056 (plasmid) [Erwinia amylovora ACW56400]|nr:hypothetical protein EaACW_pEI700056 [Erwinia amylovora ACW56400]RUT16512.1 hypothetical protein BEI72_16510 [Erwinia amylovora]